MRRRDHLNGFTAFAEAFRMGQPTERILNSSEKPRMNSAVRFLQPDKRWRLGKIGQCQYGESEQSSLREVRCRDLVTTADRSKEYDAMSIIVQIKRHEIEFGEPPLQLRVQPVESFRFMIA